MAAKSLGRFSVLSTARFGSACLPSRGIRCRHPGPVAALRVQTKSEGNSASLEQFKL
jgi:hypothetical protein